MYFFETVQQLYNDKVLHQHFLGNCSSIFKGFLQGGVCFLFVCKYVELSMKMMIFVQIISLIFPHFVLCINARPRHTWHCDLKRLRNIIAFKSFMLGQNTETVFMKQL